MPANPVAHRYYPRLSEVVAVDDLPDFLSFVENGLESLLDSIHYKNFQFSTSARGDSAFYSADIISKNIGLNLPFGLRLVLNPDAGGDTAISSFPVSLQYQWGVLGFLRSFNLQSFAFTPAAFYQLGLQLFKVTDEQVIAHILNFFVTPADDSITKYQQIIDDINIFYPGANLSIPGGQTPTVSLVTSIITQSPNITESPAELMFAMYILDGDPASTKSKLQQFYNLIVPGGLENFINGLIKPKIKATLTLSAGIEFPTNILQPVDANGNIIPNTKTIFQFAEATFYVDTEAGIGSQLDLAGSLIPQYSQIGNTGLVIGFTNAKLDLSTTTNIPEVDAAGFPVDFMGLYVQQASISFGKFGKDDPDHTGGASITAKNFLIGTGGVSGSIGIEGNGLIYRKFGAFSAELDAFALTFRQNSITKCDIAGAITLDKYTTDGQPSRVAIQAHIKDNGDFSITALPSANFPQITLPNVFTLNIRSLTVGEEHPKGYYIQIAGTLSFIAHIPVLGDILPKNINITKLRLWDDGSIDFVGGSIKLPVAFTLNIGPVKLEVSDVCIGQYTKKLNGVDRNYCYFGFDGMVNTGNAGLAVSGNGIKYYFTVDSGPGKPFDDFIRIDQIGIDITIPGNAKPEDADFILKGYLKVSNPNPDVPSSSAGTEYAGSVSVRIPKLGIDGSAAMRLNPSVPSFVVDLGLGLSTPIPLAATGLGIYGFRGLIGEHYLPSKSATTPPLPDTASWWDYYKAKNVPDGLEGIEIDKFADEPGFSIGAGVTIATEFDSGFTFSSKLFLLLGLPDVLLIQGQAGILRSRIGLNDTVDPPFSALIAIDRTSFTSNLSVNYNLPESGNYKGDIFSLQGTLAMAFFFNNASGWYINIGQDQPVSARVQAKILTLFKGYAYVMLSSQGFKAGAGASFDFNKKFGPVAFGIGANIDLGASISFKPMQIGGFIQFGGYAYLKLAWFKIGASVQVTLAAEAPHPFSITGKLQIKVNTPWPLKDIKINAEIGWHFNNDKSQLLQPVPILQLPNPAAGYSPAVAVNVMSLEAFPVNYVKYIFTGSNVTIPAPNSADWQYNFADAAAVMQVTVPLDSFIDIELLKPVIPGQVMLGGANTQLPAGYTELLPPVKSISSQVKHTYFVTGLNIYAWADNGSGGGAWMPYNIYEAVTAIVNDNTGVNAVNLGSLPPGYWQFTEPNRFNKIRLLSQNMFSFANQANSFTSNLDKLNFERKDLFCYESIIKRNIVNWKQEQGGTIYTAGSTVMIGDVSFTFTDLSGSVATDASFGANSLYLAPVGGSLLVTLPKAVTSFEIDFGQNQNNITVYPVVTDYVYGYFGHSWPFDKKLTPSYLSPTEQNTSITYNDTNQPVNKILLVIDTIYPVDFDGDLVIGGFYPLPDQFLPVPFQYVHHEYDTSKALMFASLFNKSFTNEEVLQKQYSDTDGIVGRWQLSSNTDAEGTNNGILSGDPDLVPGFYTNNGGSLTVLKSVYDYTSNADALFVPYNPALKVEDGSFSFEVTAIFSPFSGGVSTLLSKVNTNTSNGHKKGFALHLLQQVPQSTYATYTDMSQVPSFTIWLTCYNGLQCSGIQAEEKYTLNVTTSRLSASQYKHILVTVDRTSGNVNIYIDRILKVSAPIPAELGLANVQAAATYIDELSYLTTELQARKDDSGITPDKVINEAQVMDDNLNKTIQPVWRPNTTFAVAVTTKDVVDGNDSGAIAYTQVFGFRTAGPVGHFQQQSAVYQNLLQQDKADQFTLANLTDYIDYNRSTPDAQGRYNLSKPVLLHNPQISLIFSKPYMNAMYSNWDGYQGLPAVQSSLQIQLIDPYGNILSPQLVRSQLPDQAIDITNYTSLPPDQQIIFLLNQAASLDSCNPQPVTLTKKIKRGIYEFADLSPAKLYTAIFNSVYQPAGVELQIAQVHKFSFISSRFATFEDQVGSFILDATPGAELYAVYPIYVSFTTDQITQNLLPLLDDNAANDPAAVQQYAVKFDRLVFGGLQLKAFDPSVHTIINPVINVDPANSLNKKILGIIIRNPEPFNDPKLPAEKLADTVQLMVTGTDNTVVAANQFIYIHSRDTSAVFITNAAMDVAQGLIHFNYRYKIFNGNDYDTTYEEYVSPGINILTN
jgi:hypothetical protein